MSPEKLRVAVLVSVGEHPESGRERRADQDARAVEMGLTLNPEVFQLIHAGDPANEVLRSYLGMGVSSLTVLQQPPEADALHTIEQYLRTFPTDIILTGTRAETGESSGMLPFLLAERLGMPLVSNIAAIMSVSDREARVLQALPQGQRRALTVQFPFVACIDMAAPAARQSAFGAAQRGVINCSQVDTVTDLEYQQWQKQPARARPKRLKLVKAKTAADRFKAATAKTQSGSGRIVEGTEEQAAAAIYEMLREEAVLKENL